MISFNFDHAEFHALLKDIAGRLGVALNNNVLPIPASLGKGFLQALRMPNGLNVLLTDVAMNVDIKLHRMKTLPAFYILAFDEVFIRNRFEQQIDSDKLNVRSPIYTAAALHSTLFDTTVIASRGCAVRSARILFDARWLAKYFGIEKEDDLLVKYIFLKSRKLLLEPLDTDYRKYIDDIFNADPADPLYYTVLENRVTLLIERFMNRILDKMGEGEIPMIRYEEVYKMMEIEAEITRDNMAQPPTIQGLSTKFGIGPTRLKNIFKEVYGYPIYEYYQRYRMERARAMLLTGEHSVKETGYQLGYKSLSNFAKAFRQVFDYAPSDLLKAVKNA